MLETELGFTDHQSLLSSLLGEREGIPSNQAMPLALQNLV